jgi:non-ribosomal peptide synthetase component F
VALLLGDPTQQVVAIFAALRAGQAFVPLDPSHPPARLRAILTDCEAAGDHRRRPRRGAVGRRRDALSRRRRRRRPRLDRGLGPARHTGVSPLHLGLDRAPKGVVHTHASLLHAFMNSTLGLRLGPEDRLTMLGSITFAATLSDLFGALLNGAALLPYRLAEQGIAGLPAWLARERATVYFSVPSVFRRLTELLVGDKQLAGIRLVKLAGEPVLRGDLERFRRHFARGSRLLNSLGCNRDERGAAVFPRPRHGGGGRHAAGRLPGGGHRGGAGRRRRARAPAGAGRRDRDPQPVPRRRLLAPPRGRLRGGGVPHRRPGDASRPTVSSSTSGARTAR